MVMRRFHTSIAVGFFMGSVVATSQLFFLLFLVYLGYAADRSEQALSSYEESLNAFFCLVQCLLLGSFAAILGAHRSQILEKSGGGGGGAGGGNVAGTQSADSLGDTYEPPQGTLS
eukprot:CAMPEP_0178509358 /NCGR_PEP_ID=MMETSP0696-20121128/21245_1 /TAXON_ID=265572 /ORGANISM="Extubocellulus spinifer, Strain CCMP396" /LENGTH=115 /DNA_ID=CAMNT_0020138977 /DNA_START=249 /DNA_END=596 /DNA_ORIENTATION=-